MKVLMFGWEYPPHIFGGLATVSWTSPLSYEYEQAPGSFIFTLTNMHGIQPTKFPLKDENYDHAVCSAGCCI